MIPAALEPIVRAGVRAAREVPGAIALGGTVCAMYAQHRLSIDIDFVVPDLRPRFNEVREHLHEVPGWKEASARPPVLLLGSLDGVQVGFRQIRRTAPMQTVTVETSAGALTIPTLEEMLVTKAFLIYNRNTVRDFIDFATLSTLLGDEHVVAALAGIDDTFAWEGQPSVLLGVIKALLLSEPSDEDANSFGTFKWLMPRLASWQAVRERCGDIGRLLAVRAGRSP